MKKKQFMSKLAALTMAAMMGVTALPATALNVFAASNYYDENGIATPLSVSNIYVGMKDSSDGVAALRSAIETVLSSTTVSNFNVTSSEAPKVELNAGGSAYQINYGTLSGSYTGTGTVSSSSAPYTYTVDADKLSDLQSGADIEAALVQQYINDQVTTSDLTTLDDFTKAVKTALLKTGDSGANAKYSGVTYNVLNSAQYGALPNTGASNTNTISLSSAITGFSNDNGAITGTVTITATNVNDKDGNTSTTNDQTTTTASSSFTLSASTEKLPATVASTYSIDDKGNVDEDLDEVESFLMNLYPSFTISNLKYTAYQAASHDYEKLTVASNGSITVSFTMTDAAGTSKNYTGVQFTAVHGVDEIKKEAEAVINDEVATLQKDTVKTLTKTAIVSKDDMAAKINRAVAGALGVTGISDAKSYADNVSAKSNSVAKEIIGSLASGDRKAMISTTVTDYTAATSAAAGKVTGTVDIIYDYGAYMSTGFRKQTGESTDLDINSDLSSYVSSTPFEITLAQLKEVDAKKISNLESEEIAYNGTSPVKIYKVVTGNNSETDKTLVTTASGSTKYAYKNKIAMGVTFANNANTYNVVWTSSDPTIAAVDVQTDSAKAIVTGINGGKATIKASLVDADGKVLSSKSKVVTVNGFQFIDVQDSSKFYYDDIYDLYDDGIVSGKTSSIFDPDGEVTRGQFITMMYNAYLKNGGRAYTAESTFNDVDTSKFYAAAINWAKSNGITAGKTATTFDPDGAVTRGQAVTFLYKAVSDGSSYNVREIFDDVNSSQFYYEPVYWAFRNGVTSGKTATLFAPDDTCTRGQAATFINQVKGAID